MAFLGKLKVARSREPPVSARHLQQDALSEALEDSGLFLQGRGSASPPAGLVQNEEREEK